MDAQDWQVRLAAFRFLVEQTDVHGDLLPYRVLTDGFQYEGERVPLIGPQGIFKPHVLARMPLTITTAPLVAGKARPYDDELTHDGLIRYRYRGTDPHHRDNAGLRTAMSERVPLIYLYGVVRGAYVASWPAFVVGDDPTSLTFTVQVDEAAVLAQPTGAVFDDSASARRRYITVSVQRRLHQAAFRERVLSAYRHACAVCRLKHQELLDAAHILPDRHASGLPVVPNGLALCRLHHAAFDGHLLGVRPDLRIEIADRVLREKDGPMLIHGLQGFHLHPLRVPSTMGLRPALEFIEARYEIFRSAG